MGRLREERLRLTWPRLDRLPRVMRCNNVFGICMSLQDGLLRSQWQLGLQSRRLLHPRWGWLWLRPRWLWCPRRCLRLAL